MLWDIKSRLQVEEKNKVAHSDYSIQPTIIGCLMSISQHDQKKFPRRPRDANDWIHSHWCVTGYKTTIKHETNPTGKNKTKNNCQIVPVRVCTLLLTLALGIVWVCPTLWVNLAWCFCSLSVNISCDHLGEFMLKPVQRREAGAFRLGPRSKQASLCSIKMHIGVLCLVPPMLEVWQLDIWDANGGTAPSVNRLAGLWRYVIHHSLRPKKHWLLGEDASTDSFGIPTIP